MKNRRGFYIVSMLLFAVIAAMFASAAIALGPAGFQRTQNSSQRLQAQRAIQSGVDYALARLRQTPGGAWRGNPATPFHFQDGSLVVSEEDGQVEGWVKDGPSWSRFRLRFNLEDGSGGLDGMGNANQPWTDLPLISLNNLPYNPEAAVPHLDATGAVTAGPPRFNLQGHTLLLSVEGSSGSAILGNSGPVGFSGAPSVHKAEYILGISGYGSQPLDSLASARGNLHFGINANQTVRFGKTGNSNARLRAKGSVTVTDSAGAGGNLNSSLGELRTLNGNSVGSTQLQGTISQSLENPNDAFYSIPLASTPQVSAQAASLAGGVYEVDLVNGQPQVTFYPMSYPDYLAGRQAGTLSGGVPANLDSSIQVSTVARPNGSPMVEMRFTKDTKVSGSLQSLAIVPAKGALREGDAPLPGAGAASSPGLFLADLAGKLHLDMPPLTASGNIDAFSGNFPTSAGLASLLAAESGGGSGNINVTGGVSISYSSGQDIQTVNNYDNHFDGLPNHEYKLGALQLAQYFWISSQSNSQLASQLASYVGRGLPSGFGQGIPPDVGFGAALPSAGGLGVKDLKITMQDAGNSERGSVTLRADRDVVLGGMLEGQGGAVVTAGNLSLLGNGLDLSAHRAANSINLYSGGDILVDGFAFDDSSSSYNDVKLAGVMYAWGNIHLNAGQVGSSLARGHFSLTGAVVAYGGNPSQSGGTPSDIDITASSADLTFDPSYLLNLEDSPVRADSHFQIRAYRIDP